MKYCVLTIGSFPGRALPTIASAFSCGAVNAVPELHIFHLSAQKAVISAASLVDSLSLCHDLISVPDEPLPVFQTRFSFGTCAVDLPSGAEYTSDPDSDALFSALHGDSGSFSFQKDREQNEWAFACLLNDRPNHSCDTFFSFLEPFRAELAAGGGVRLAILCDLTDPFSAGAAFALIPWLRSCMPGNLAVSLIALAETTLPMDETFFPDLARTLRDLDQRSFLRDADDSTSAGTDAMWFISLPSTLLDSERSHVITFFAAARALSAFCAPGCPVPAGFHTCEASGSVSLNSLGFRASNVAAFIEYASWLVSDLFPSLHGYLDHPSSLKGRVLPNPRNSLFKSLLSLSSEDRLNKSVGILEHTIRLLLQECVSFLESVPSALRYSEEAQSLWQKATDACGRYITVASEVDVTRAEIRESGLEGVKPVHRVSMADTDEELLQNQLEQMEQQLAAETRMRDESLAAVGPFRALQARRDCLLKCRDALEAAEKKIAALPAETTEHLTFAMQERRIRLLRSAVSQSESDLSLPSSPAEIPDSFSPAMATPVILTQTAIQAIRKVLNEKPGESSGRELRDCLPVLLQDTVLPDGKELLKSLLAESRAGSSGQPLTDMLRRAWNVCFAAASSLRFAPRDNWPLVSLLPDLFPSAPVTDLREMTRLIPRDAVRPEQEEAEKRGLLAMLFLAHYKRRMIGEPGLDRFVCRSDAAFLRLWLPGQHTSGVHILSLANDDTSLPFAVVVPGRLFIPAERTATHPALVPGFVTWFNRETDTFEDPCPSLSEGDRSLLSGRLAEMLAAWPENSFSPLKDFLSAFLDSLASWKEGENGKDTNFNVRVRAVCGLRLLAPYQDILVREQRFYEHNPGIDPVAASLTGIDDFRSSLCEDIADEVLYTWRGIPFARENSRLVLEGTCSPDEDHALEAMEKECRTLSGVSDDYRDALSREAALMLEKYPLAAEENADMIRGIIRKAEKPLSGHTPELVWPWDPNSPSVQTILAECLGSTLCEAASNPFSDLLAVFPARGSDAIGDSYFGVMCSVLPYGSEKAPSADAPVISPDAVLPPLSPALVSAVCTTSEGRLLLTPDFLRLDHPDEQSFRITLTLNGAFALRLTRVYDESEILFLYAHDLPTLALWPSVPFRAEQWQVYYVYAHLPDKFSVSVLPAGSSDPVPLDGTGLRFSAVFRQFPAAFLFSKEEKTIGALPNLLPEPEITPSGNVTACIDFGSVASSVVLSSGDTRKPLQGTTTVRILLNNPASTPEYLRREFLPAVPVSALLPSVLRVFRDSAGSDPVPFVDGALFMSLNLQDIASVLPDTLRTCMKWNSDLSSEAMICLHQVMLITALQARTDGASGLSWRFAVPDDMPSEDRESFMAMIRPLTDRVMEESGFSQSVGAGPRLLFATESAALGAYFRLCAWEDTRGGFMVLDLGAITADISLFLRGKPQAVRTCQIPLGIHYMLLPSLLKDPLLLHREFGAWPDTAFQSDLNSLSRILDTARTDPAVVTEARLALDHFLTDHYPSLVSALGQLGSAGIPSRFGAVLLLHLSYITMLSGLLLLQIAADPNKNDFLPEQMSLCLSGRGALLIESLPDSLKSELWRFLTMFRNKRVASLSLLFSAEKKMEIPVGLSVMQDLSDKLPPAAAVSASLSVRPEELLPEFLLRFLRVFPREAALLFPNFFTGDYYHPFSPSGEAIITEAIDTAFEEQETPRPYKSLADWIAVLLSLVDPVRPDQVS